MKIAAEVELDIINTFVDPIHGGRNGKCVSGRSGANGLERRDIDSLHGYCGHSFSIFRAAFKDNIGNSAPSELRADADDGQKAQCIIAHEPLIQGANNRPFLGISICAVEKKQQGQKQIFHKNSGWKQIRRFSQSNQHAVIGVIETRVKTFIRI